MLGQYVTIRAIEKLSSAPNTAFSVRGLASAIGISPAASRMALDFMKKKGIATLNVVGNTYQYRASLESALCRQWKVLFNLDLLADSGIVQSLREKIPNLQSVLLYGSFARGTNDEKSDVDIMAIAHKAVKIVPGFSGRIKREVNLTVLSSAEWKAKAVKDRVFYENVIYDSIVLYGERPVVL